MKSIDVFEYEWPYLLTLLAADVDLDASAREFGALRRRRRVSRAEDLLRLALAYSVCGMSLRQTAAWAQVADVAHISDVALLKRLRSAGDWLGFLLAAKLAERAGQAAIPPASLRLFLVDATVVTQPGGKGTDWRVHLGYDPSGQAVEQVEVTTGRGGERLDRFALAPDMLVLADRVYATRTNLRYVRRHQAHYVIRATWKNIPLRRPDGEPFDLFSAARALPEATVGDFAVRIPADRQRSIPADQARLIVARKSEATAAQGRKDLIRAGQRKQKMVDARSLEAAGYVLLLTSLPSATATAHEVLELYRYRWQVELAFKRLKSLQRVGDLPAKDPRLARCFLHAKLLGALLIDDLTDRFLAFSPWGYRLDAPAVPVADSARVD